MVNVVPEGGKFHSFSVSIAKRGRNHFGANRMNHFGAVSSRKLGTRPWWHQFGFQLLEDTCDKFRLLKVVKLAGKLFEINTGFAVRSGMTVEAMSFEEFANIKVG